MGERIHRTIEIIGEGREMLIEIPIKGTMFSDKTTVLETVYPFKSTDMEQNVFYGYITMRKGRR